MKTSLNLWHGSPYLYRPTRDVHITLKLTIRLICTIPSKLIHPALLATFGEEICSLGDAEATPTLVDEVMRLCDGLPKTEHTYEKSLLKQLSVKVNEDPILCSTDLSSLFYMALIERASVACVDQWCDLHEKTQEQRTRIQQFVRALYLQLFDSNAKEASQAKVYRFIMCLVRFEFADRYNMAIQVMGCPIYLDRDINRKLLFGFFHEDEHWRQMYATVVAKRFIRCPALELIRKMRGMYIDLATFMLSIDQIRVDASILPTLESYCRFYSMINPIEKDPNKRFGLFLAFLTPLFHHYIEMKRRSPNGISLTNREYSQIRNLKTSNRSFISVDEFIQFIVLSPFVRTTNPI